MGGGRVGAVEGSVRWKGREGGGSTAGHDGHSAFLSGAGPAVQNVAVNADWRRAVSASYDNTLKVWDVGSGRELRTLAGHSSAVQSVAVGADGRRAVSASDDYTVKVWDVETGAVVTTFTCDAPAQCCAFAGVRKIVAGDRAGQVLFTIRARGSGHVVFTSGDKTLLLSAA
jgi:WD40 repeat protein